MRKTIIASLIVSSLAALCFGQENYAGWLYYRFLTVNTSATGANVGATEVNFPVLVRLNSSNFTFAHAKGNGADIRFTKSDGVTRLKHQIEHWDSAGQTAEVWVLMDTVRGNNATQSIRVYSEKAAAADSSNGAAVFSTANNFQGVFHLGENTNDTARDATSNLFKGIPKNKGGLNPTDTVGAIGHAKKFLGIGTANLGGSYQILTSAGGNTYTNNALNFQNDSSTINGQPLYTLSAWMYISEFPDGTGNLKAAIAKSTGLTSSTQYALRLRDPAINQVTHPLNDTQRVDFIDPVPAVYKSGVNMINPGNWYHVAAVRSGARGDSTHLRVWINGYSPAAGSGITSTSISTTTRQDMNVYIGSFSNDSGYFNGTLDEVRFENNARDSSWLMLCYQTQKPGSGVVSASAEQVQVVPTAPTSLTYATNPLVGTAGVAITPDAPTVLPGGVTGLTYTTSPALPAGSGMTFDATTGILSGTPPAGFSLAPTNVTVTATNISGSASVVVSVAVNAPPSITTQPAAATVTIGSATTAKMWVKTSGSTPMTYKWIRTRGATIDTVSTGIFSRNAGGDTLSITGTGALATDSGQIKCLVTNVAGSATSSNAHLTVGTVGIWSPKVIHVQGMSPFSFRIPPTAGVANVRMTVENMDGRVVWSKDFAAGKSGIVSWNGGGSDGRPVSSGMYVVRMKLLSVDNKTTSEIDQTGIINSK